MSDDNKPAPVKTPLAGWFAISGKPAVNLDEPSPCDLRRVVEYSRELQVELARVTNAAERHRELAAERLAELQRLKKHFRLNVTTERSIKRDPKRGRYSDEGSCVVCGEYLPDSDYTHTCKPASAEGDDK
jgi:hypothetical protein